MLQSTWVLYTGYRFHWSPRDIGASLMVVGVMSIIVQGKLVGPILRRTGEERGLLIGLASTALVFIGYGLATQGWMMYAIICIGSFGALAGPAGQALITKRVPATEQGAVQGALGGLQSLAGVIAPPIAAWSFAAGVGEHARLHVPGLAFFEAAVLVVIALAIASRAVRVPVRLAPPMTPT
jgi:DHA1 family tetracycline resistance protein-like MFS transporter